MNKIGYFFVFTIVNILFLGCGQDSDFRYTNIQSRDVSENKLSLRVNVDIAPPVDAPTIEDIPVIVPIEQTPLPDNIVLEPPTATPVLPIIMPKLPIMEHKIINGKILGDYLKGVNICFDKNQNIKCDKNETSTTTNSSGEYNLTGLVKGLDNYHILAEINTSAISVENNKSILEPYILMAHSNEVFISPISTLIQTYIYDNNKTNTQKSISYIAKALGENNNTLLQDYMEQNNTKLHKKAKIITILQQKINKKLHKIVTDKLTIKEKYQYINNKIIQKLNDINIQSKSIFTPSLISQNILNDINLSDKVKYEEIIQDTIKIASNYSRQVISIFKSPMFKIVKAPTGMTINKKTGMIYWTPTPNQVGKLDVNITITNKQEIWAPLAPLAKIMNTQISVLKLDVIKNNKMPNLNNAIFFAPNGSSLENNIQTTYKTPNLNTKYFCQEQDKHPNINIFYYRGGTYTNANFSKGLNNKSIPAITCNGKEDNPIIIKPWGNEKVKIKFDSAYGIRLYGDYLQLEGFEIEGIAQDINYSNAISNWWMGDDYFNGIGLSIQGSNIVVKNNIIHDIPSSGIINKQNAILDKVIIDNNIIFNTSWWSVLETTAIGFVGANENPSIKYDINTSNIEIKNNLIFSSESRIFSRKYSDGFSNLSISKGFATLITKTKNSTYSKGFLLKNNFYLYNGNGVLLNSDNVYIENNTFYNNGTTALNSSSIDSNDSNNLVLKNNAIYAQINNTNVINFLDNTTIKECSNNIYYGTFKNEKDCSVGVSNNKLDANMFANIAKNDFFVKENIGANMSILKALDLKLRNIGYEIKPTAYKLQINDNNYSINTKEYQEYQQKQIIQNIPNKGILTSDKDKSTYKITFVDDKNPTEKKVFYLKSILAIDSAVKSDNLILKTNEKLTMQEESKTHKRTWMGFVSSNDIWENKQIPEVERNLALIAKSIAKYEPVSILVNPKDVDLATELLGGLDSHKFPITLIKSSIDDLWLRDTAPIFVTQEDKTKKAIDFNFNGWGNKQKYENDSKVATFISKIANIEIIKSNLVLEGGSIEIDGNGTAIITKSSVLNDNRNPNITQEEFEKELKHLLGLRKIIWLNGIKGKDITDAHIDFYARFSKVGTVLVSRENYEDSYDYDVTRENIKILQNATDASGNKLQVIIIDAPQSFNQSFGVNNFAPGYLGYYSVNNAIIMQKFGDLDADKNAFDIIKAQFPNKIIEQILIDGISSGGGTIHCTTQQEPK